MNYPYSSLLFNALTLGIIFQNRSGQILTANPAAEKILGLTVDQMRGVSSIDPRWRAVHENGEPFPGDTHPAMEALATGLAVTDVVMGVFNPLLNDLTWINVSAFPISDEVTGECHGVYALFDDITAQTLAIQSRKESEKRFQSLFESMSEGMALNQIVSDSSGQAQDYLILDVNPAFEHQTGIARQAVVGKLASVVYGTTQAPFLDIYAKVARTRQAIKFDRSFSPLNRHFQITVFSPYSEQFATVFEDITERKQLADALKSSEQRFRSFVENVNDVLFVLGPTGVLSYVSPQWMRASGFEQHEVVGQSFQKFVHPDDVSVCLASLQRAIETGERQEGIEYRALRKDGSCLWHMANASVIIDPESGFSLVGIARDVSESKHIQIALAASEDKFKKAFLLNPDSININRLSDGVYVSINSGFTRIMGYTADDVIGHSSLEFSIWVDPNERALLVAGLREAGKVENLEASFRAKDGSIRVGLMSAVIIDIDAAPHILSITRDISKLKEAQEQQLLSASVFAQTREGILITSANLAIVSVNDAFTNITGYRREEVLGKNPNILGSGRQSSAFYRDLWLNLEQNGFWKGEIWNRRKNGEVYAEMLTISVVKDAQGNIKNYVGIFTDITALKEHAQELEHIAHFDALTNLPNRVLLADRLRQGMAQALRRSQLLAVVYLDLDGFKAINDRHGHEIGDQLLVTIASRMKQTLRDGDTLARLGGDEFVAVLQDLDDIGASVPMLNRLLAAAYQSLQIGKLDVQVSASLGVTFYPQSGDVEADQLLRQADQAMYQAKVTGKNKYHIFDATQDSSLRIHYESLVRIELALNQNEFVLHYQPKVNMRTGEIIGAEALIRWQHPQRGLLAPSEFLPIIENHSLAVDVGEWVIATALAQIEIWRKAGLNLAVSVNVGARQLQQGNFFDRLRKLLAARPSVNPSLLELEVLETSALEDIAQVSRLIESCTEIGVTFALDDFGTGYSSLTYLKRLRVDVLKIDQSFVRDMLDDPDDLAILEGVIGLAAAFRRQVIAEGVETVAHGTLLLQLGCDLAQGYGIARPMPAHKLPLWVTYWQPDPAWSGLPWLGGQASD